jgi:histidyl-tRNA synthetase
VFVAVADPARREDAIGLVAALRDAGLWSEMDLGGRSLKAQFKVAGRRRSRLVAVVGDEWSEGLVTVRRMSDGEERPVVIEEVASWATNH